MTALIEALLGRVSLIIGLLSSVLGLVTGINATVAKSATEPEPGEMYSLVFDTSSQINNVTYGLAALQADLVALAAQITALGTPQQAGSPVTLPSSAPTGFLAGDSLSIADGVWNTIPTSFVRIMGDALVLTAQMQAGEYTFNSPVGYGHFKVNNINFATNDYYLPTFAYAVFDPSDILIGDTLLSMMTRQNPGASVSYGWPPQTQVLVSPAGHPNVEWITDIDETQFSELKAFIYPPPQTLVAPVWPGLSQVTLGTPVAIDIGVTITSPMAGVLVDITSVPSKQGQFNFDTSTSWRNIGALSFFDDNGQNEYPQTLGFVHCVYLPKCMAVAAGVQLRASGGVAGTITPFTIP